MDVVEPERQRERDATDPFRQVDHAEKLPPRMAALLELDDVSARYGQVQALHGISLTVGEGEVVALLGANGAGKTTTLRAVSGTVRRERRRSSFARQATRPRRPGGGRARRHRARAGRARDLRRADGLGEPADGRVHAPRPARLRTVLAYFPWLESRRNQQAGTLSGGEQQMLALARAFLQRPQLLMLDEPSLGLAPLVTREVFRVVADLNAKEGLAVLVVEQNAAIALRPRSRAYVLETGSIAVDGNADELRANDAVRSAYLGY